MGLTNLSLPKGYDPAAAGESYHVYADGQVTWEYVAELVSVTRSDWSAVIRLAGVTRPAVVHSLGRNCAAGDTVNVVYTGGQYQVVSTVKAAAPTEVAAAATSTAPSTSTPSTPSTVSGFPSGSYAGSPGTLTGTWGTDSSIIDSWLTRLNNAMFYARGDLGDIQTIFNAFRTAIQSTVTAINALNSGSGSNTTAVNDAVAKLNEVLTVLDGEGIVDKT